MTTLRHRRSMREQVSDMLQRLLRSQDAKATKLHLLWEDAIEEADRTRRALEVLGQEMPPGIEKTPEESERIATPVGSLPTFRELVGDDVAHPNTMREGLTISEPTAIPRRRYRQRIGKKAPLIDDVWNAKEGSVTVHSALMYARQKSCELCRAGVPFATKERTGHHVTISYSDGVERGFEYRPCGGAA